ncbi:MAG: lactonase family protein [Asticcacaulis sp.]|nr:lactonase family protein [Asticcacaulis sp.]
MRHSTNRRLFMAGAAAFAATPAFAGTNDLELFVGTYNSDTVKGIYPLTYRAADDSWTLGEVVAQVENISFGAYSPRFKRHYLLNEADVGTVGAWTADKGAWISTGEVQSHGKWPCYAALSRDGGALAVVNYGTGNVVVYEVCTQTGNPLEPATIRQNSGKGPNADRQEGPHAHWVQFAPDQTRIYSIDLGTDQVLGYAYDAKTHAVGEAFVAYQAAAGAGPRHMAFHPNREVAFLVTELSNRLISLKLNADGSLSEIANASLLPPDFTAHSQAAHIAINDAGTRVYASNRGHNSIAVFEVDGKGMLNLLQIAPTTVHADIAADRDADIGAPETPFDARFMP